MQATTRISAARTVALDLAEVMLAAMVAAIGLAAAFSAALRAQAVDWAAFAPALAASAALVALGGWMRARRGMRRLALAAIGTGVFMGFSGASAIFIYTLFPVHNALVDTRLAGWDAALGYDWTAFVGWLADHPLVGVPLAWVYHSSLVQIVGLIVVLAALGRGPALHRFLMTGVTGMTATVAIWWCIPSLGPSTLFDVPPDAAARIGLVFSPEMGDWLSRLAAQGVPVITPDVITGVIAFPSFHMFMALMCLWFARGTWLWWLYLPLNIAMVPATLAHGAHHMVDLMAAGAVFALCTALSSRLVRAG
jgi:hypothetical protein